MHVARQAQIRAEIEVSENRGAWDCAAAGAAVASASAPAAIIVPNRIVPFSL
jgi:hypothetical protein